MNLHSYVNLESSEQSIVSSVSAGGRELAKNQGQLYEKQIAHAPEPPLRSPDEVWGALAFPAVRGRGDAAYTEVIGAENLWGTGMPGSVVARDRRRRILGYHLHYPSRRQSAPAFALLVDALRYCH